ncbi:hypothetical protein B0A48_17729 [Cryoendolithus antarcticus]|uniref:Uncharacterized protein n=1 Tax=Cryoendolithus antarcticus TaxID=1507870 RepID=A0A1V8S9T3_9PEZI|nr:hypothetical protein B0A48_17729 [Cryoendolithus antarcticus]
MAPDRGSASSQSSLVTLRQQCLRYASTGLAEVARNDDAPRSDASNLEPISHEAKLSTGRVAVALSLRLPSSDDPGDSSKQLTQPEDDFAITMHQCSVESRELKGQLLIDRSSNAENWSAWIQILQFRQRLHGHHGVMAVYHGLRLRTIDLPVQGPHADVLWNSIFDAGISMERAGRPHGELWGIYRHANVLRVAHGKVLRDLYTRMIGRLLRIASNTHDDQQSVVLKWHRRLVRDNWYGSGDARRLVADVLQSASKKIAFHAFEVIYDAVAEHDCYDHCMPIVFEHGDEADVDAWHDLFVRHGDMPSAGYAAISVVSRLLGHVEDDRGNTSVPNRSLRKGPAVATPASPRSMLNSLLGEVHGITPKLISDSFCAKLFATSAFSIDFVIRTLNILGVEALGPLALRELAMRTKLTHDVDSRLTQIKAAGLQLTDCMYTRLLCKVVNDRSEELYRALICSDQHPENHDDSHMQKTLLANFVEAGDGLQVQLTLLCLQQADVNLDHSVWNRILQHCAKQGNWDGVTKAFQHIQSEGMPLSVRSINFLRKYVLPIRTRGKQPVPSGGIVGNERVARDFVLKACIYAAEHGQHVPPFIWTELLKRYGMEYNMDGVETITTWLVEHYHKDAKPLTRPPRTHDPTRISSKAVLRAALTDNMLRAIVMWGIRDAGQRDLLHESNSDEKRLAISASHDAEDMFDIPVWARGLIILKKLRGRGFHVKTQVVREALRQQLWVMFGPSASMIPANAQIMERNRLSLAHYVLHAQRIWRSGNVHASDHAFVVPDWSAEEQGILYRRVFGDVRMVRQQTREYADVKAWVSDGNHVEERRERSPYNLRLLWETSPHRIGGAAGDRGLMPYDRRPARHLRSTAVKMRRTRLKINPGLQPL